MNRTSWCGIAAVLAFTFSVLGQTRVYPLCHTVQHVDPGLDHTFVPMIMVVDQADPALAAAQVYNSLVADSGWLNSDGSNVMIKFRDHGQEFQTGDRAFFDASDSLPGYPASGSGPAWKHPFLKNATLNGRMRVWMTSFREALRPMVASSSSVSLAKCQFAFDSEARVTDEDANSVKMLKFLAESSMWVNVEGARLTRLATGRGPREQHHRSDAGAALR